MMDAPRLFDVEPHGTPCLVCGETACVCRAAGTLAATPGAWPIDPPPATVPAQPATLPARYYDPATDSWHRVVSWGEPGRWLPTPLITSAFMWSLSSYSDPDGRKRPGYAYVLYTVPVES